MFFFRLFEQFRSVETAHFSSCPKHLHLPLRRGIETFPRKAERLSATVHFPFPTGVKRLR